MIHFLLVKCLTVVVISLYKSAETHIVPVIFCSVPERYRDTLPAAILYYSTLSGTNRQILTPKRYGKHPPDFCRDLPQRGTQVYKLRGGTKPFFGFEICDLRTFFGFEIL